MGETIQSGAMVHLYGADKEFPFHSYHVDVVGVFDIADKARAMGGAATLIEIAPDCGRSDQPSKWFRANADGEVWELIRRAD